VLALGVLDLAHRRPLRGAFFWRNLVLRLVAGFTVALLHLVFAECFFEVVRRWRGRDVSFWTALLFSLRCNCHVNVLTYWGGVALRHLRDYDRGLREKALVAERLRGQLPRSRRYAAR
jgi:hypothetical protein